MSKFEDSQFEQAHRELENPQIDGWELFLKSHDVTIYRLYTEVMRTFFGLIRVCACVCFSVCVCSGTGVGSGGGGICPPLF